MRILLAAAILAFAPSAAFACSCMQQSVQQQIRESEIIFVGRVGRTENLGGFNQATTFRVSETLKGTSQRSRRIFHWRNDGGNCGMDFRRGQRMLIAARRLEGRLQVNACSMPQHSEPAFRAALKARKR